MILECSVTHEKDIKQQKCLEQLKKETEGEDAQVKPKRQVALLKTDRGGVIMTQTTGLSSLTTFANSHMHLKWCTQLPR
jgi:hypothetical protein